MGLGIVIPILERQLDKKIEQETETDLYGSLHGLKFRVANS